MSEEALGYPCIVGRPLWPQAGAEVDHQSLVELQNLLNVAEQGLDVILSEGIVVSMLFLCFLKNVLWEKQHLFIIAATRVYFDAPATKGRLV